MREQENFWIPKAFGAKSQRAEPNIGDARFLSSTLLFFRRRRQTNQRITSRDFLGFLSLSTHPDIFVYPQHAKYQRHSCQHNLVVLRAIIGAGEKLENAGER
jgi:hypothetical protein